MTPVVIGIDPSLTSTGVAIIKGSKITTRRIQSKGSATATLAERAARLDLIKWEIGDIVYDAEPALVVIEGPSFGQARQGGQHDRAGLWWLIIDTLKTAGALLPIAEVPPTVRAKYATGAGNASKDAVLAAAIKRYPTADITGNDVADAVILAAIGARHLGYAVDLLPVVHLAAMTKIRWPD